MKVTVKNLMNFFIRKSQKIIRYDLYADTAKKEKFFIISKAFKDFAYQEKEYANWSYRMLEQLKKEEPFENLTIEIKCPTIYGTTIQNLEASIEGEDEEWQYLYPNFANTAEMEGFLDIGERLIQLAKTERNRSQRLNMFLNLIKKNAFFKKSTITFWKCMSCGYEVVLDELPNHFKCPSCDHLKAYFQKKVLQLEINKKSIERKEISGWVCMECGEEVHLEELPDDWKCTNPTCGRSKAYFKRKVFKPKEYKISTVQTEKAHWTCLECGNEEEIELPAGWKCSKCGFPSQNSNSPS